jgi:aryl carrier-like protein
MISLDETREIFPYEEVAKFYEHRAKDNQEALRWVGEALDKVQMMSLVERNALRHRHERLVLKVKRKT